MNAYLRYTGHLRSGAVIDDIISRIINNTTALKISFGRNLTIVKAAHTIFKDIIMKYLGMKFSALETILLDTRFPFCFGHLGVFPYLKMSWLVINPDISECPIFQQH